MVNLIPRWKLLLLVILTVIICATSAFLIEGVYSLIPIAITLIVFNIILRIFLKKKK